ncbi:low temperature requirement protein A [Gordonia sinesedis]
MLSVPRTIGHRLTRMTGRDPRERGRSATNLELFYDLVFVVAFSTAGAQVAQQLAAGQYQAAVLGYVFCTFAAIWAWMNFAWFASAFEIDDWFFRLVTLVQMIGVSIIALGMPEVFTSLVHHEHVNNRVLVIGYIVMRIGMIAQWLRAAVQSPEHRRACLIYATMTVLAQIGWVAVLIADMRPYATLFGVLGCIAIELLGPILAECTTGGTPWHPHHIAERYSLLTIITLGEGVVGTVAVLGALIETQGWSWDTGILGLAAMTTTFAMWWMYFGVPVGDALHHDRGKGLWWGYSHVGIFIGAAAVGAGLHVGALWIEGEAKIGPGQVVATLAIPLGVYCLGVLAMYDLLLPFEPLTIIEAAGVVALLVASVWLAAAGVSVIGAVVIAALAPVFVVVLDETVGVRRRARAMACLGVDATVK